MIIGFVIWSIVSLVLMGIGIWAWGSEKPVNFFSGVKPPEVRDARKYNRAVAVLWFVYAVLFELLGLPMLLLKQNAAGLICMVLGVAFLTIALMIAYNRILSKHKQD